MERKKMKRLLIRKRITPAKLSRQHFDINIQLPERQHAHLTNSEDEDLPGPQQCVGVEEDLLPDLDLEDPVALASSKSTPIGKNNELPKAVDVKLNDTDKLNNKNRYRAVSSSSEDDKPLSESFTGQVESLLHNVSCVSVIPDDLTTEEENHGNGDIKQSSNADTDIKQVVPQHTEKGVERKDTKAGLIETRPTAELEPGNRQHQGTSLTHFSISAAEWQKVKPEETMCRRRLQGDWTDIFSKILLHHFPGCVFSFKANQIKCKNSRKKRAKYFGGHAVCKLQHCSTRISMTISSEPVDGKDVTVDVCVTGEAQHTGEASRRNLKGTQRDKVSRKARADGVMEYYYSQISANEEQIDKGDFTSIPKPSVLRQAVSECIKKELLHKDIIQELVLLKEVYENDDDDPKVQYAGYIQYIAVSPFKVIMFCQNQLNLVLSIWKESAVDLYLDATGGIMRKLPRQKRCFMYSLVLKPKHTPPVSACDMLTTDHTIPNITHFLMFFMRAICLRNRKFKPRKVETDFSWALIQSALRTFNDIRLKKYLSLVWDICCYVYETVQDITVLHLCIAHMTKDVSGVFRSITKKNRDSHKLLMQCFALLSNETSMKQTQADFATIVSVLLLKTDTPCREKALKDFRQRVKDIGEDIPDTTEDLDDQLRLENTHLSSEEESTIREASPWTKFFSDIRKQTEEAMEDDKDTSGMNDVFKSALDVLSKRFLPIFPLWSGILLGDLQRYGKSRKLERTVVQETRDSNANVESWFRLVKVDTLKSKMRLRPAEIISKLKKSLNGRLKEAEHPELRTSKCLPPAAEAIDLATEKWSKKGRARKKNLHQPKKLSSSSTAANVEGSDCLKTNVGHDTFNPSSLPTVPKWGGHTQGTILSNTCTIDNFLTILHVYASENTSFVNNCRQGDSDVMDTLLECLSLMREDKFDDAKVTWVKLIQKGLSAEVNLYGSEYEMYGKHFQRLVTSRVDSKCTSKFCPEPSKQRTLKGLVLSGPSAESREFLVQQTLSEWISPCARRCPCSLNDQQTDGIPSELIHNSKITDADSGIEHLEKYCGGERRETRVVLSLPPVLVFQVGHAALNTHLSDYDETITLADNTFRLAGITLYTPGHFISCIFSVRHGWLKYDGLQGQLQPYAKGMLSGCSPQNFIYCKV